MTALLKALGWLSIASGIILGFIFSNQQDEINRTLRLMGAGTSTTPPIAIWVYWAAAGLVSSVLWFALSNILENQEGINRQNKDLHRLLRRIQESIPPSTQERWPRTENTRWTGSASSSVAVSPSGVEATSTETERLAGAAGRQGRAC